MGHFLCPKHTHHALLAQHSCGTGLLSAYEEGGVIVLSIVGHKGTPPTCPSVIQVLKMPPLGLYSFGLFFQRCTPVGKPFRCPFARSICWRRGGPWLTCTGALGLQVRVEVQGRSSLPCLPVAFEPAIREAEGMGPV